MNRLFFVLLAQVLIPAMCYAQANFFKGYLVTNTGDTVRGFVQARERELNPRFLRFKNEIDDVARVVQINDAKAYGVDLGDAYERHSVEMSMSKIKGDIATGMDTLKQSDVVFLKVINKGKNVSLFSFKDAVKERFYIQERTDFSPIELSRQLFYADQNHSQLITQTKYRNQLEMLMRKYRVDQKEDGKVEKLSYAESDLLHITNLINHQKDVKSHHQASRFYVGAALTTGSIKYTGFDLIPNSKNKLSVGPLFKAGLDVFANPATGKMIFRAEVAVLRNKFTTANGTRMSNSSFASHSFTQTSIVFTPQILQNVYNAPLTKVFVGLGLDINIPFYSKVVFERQYANVDGSYYFDYNFFDNGYISIPMVAGIVLNKKLEFSMGYSFPKNIFKGRVLVLEMDKYRLGFSYFLGKR